MEVYFRKTLDGNIQGSCEENPHKIVFVSGYRPENKNSWRGPLPADKEVWSCELVRDTQPETKRRGALLVRLVKRLQKEFFLVEEASEFEGLPYYKVRARVGSQEIDFVGTEIPETIKSRVSARIAEIEKAKETLVAQCLEYVKKYYNGVFTLPSGITGYSRLSVIRDSREIEQSFIIGRKNVSAKHILPPCFKEENGKLIMVDLAEAEKLFGEARVHDYLSIYWTVDFPDFNIEVKVENPPVEEVVNFFRPKKEESGVEEVKVWGGVELSSTVGWGEHLNGTDFRPVYISDTRRNAVLQDKKAMELLRATIKPFEVRLNEIMVEVFNSFIPDITTSICSIWNMTTGTFAYVGITSEDVQEWYPESDDGYRSGGTCWVTYRYDTLFVDDRSWVRRRSYDQEVELQVGSLRAFFLEREKSCIEENIKRLRSALDVVFASAVEARSEADKSVYGDALPEFKMPSMVGEVLERVQKLVDTVFSQIPGCLEKDKKENVINRVNQLREFMKNAMSESASLENKARNLRIWHSPLFYPSQITDGEIEKDPWRAEANLLKEVQRYEEYKREKLEVIHKAEQEKAEREAKMLEGSLKAKGEEVGTDEWYDLAIQEAYHLVRELSRDYVADKLTEALGYGAKRRLVIFNELFNGANIRLTDPVYNNDQTRRIANGVKEMVLKNCPSVPEPVVVFEPKPSPPASLDMLKAKFGKKR